MTLFDDVQLVVVGFVLLTAAEWGILKPLLAEMRISREEARARHEEKLAQDRKLQAQAFEHIVEINRLLRSLASCTGVHPETITEWWDVVQMNRIRFDAREAAEEDRP